MQVTKEILAKHDEIRARLDDITERASDALKNAEDNYGEQEVERTIERKVRIQKRVLFFNLKPQVVTKKEVVKVKKKYLWQEVYELGHECEAGKLLKETHPEVFKLTDEQKKVAEEYRQYIIDNFGIDYQAMRFGDYLKLMDLLIAYRLEK